ncbi:Na+/H+ antiporter subunit E [Planctobacterium marinum]|uniref:Na+/H+ antiporter subunit E n=1 Tax=Planctobacterium marinum TaxID=1631968 RepID=UPI001E622783|nr:Na+/H+ antiporter subunit E [Planctobacterium marinum]MCC2604940.1 Na+/H+ antiporter subunit E [Planctobacterium marinum]
MRHTLSFSMTLAVFWLLMSGHTSLLILSLGLASVLAVLYIVYRLNILDGETHPVGFELKLPRFLSWLLLDLFLSNLLVVKHIWQFKPAISPKLITYTLSQMSDMEKAIYANAISVTPGTISIDLQQDSITVHALTDSAFSNILSGEKGQKVRQLVS